MCLNFDLHVHSTASDGTLSPAELVRHAAAKGVDVLALTDHDTTSGVAEAAGAAVGLGLDIVPGVEVSVTWRGGVVHVVGLGIDPDCEVLQVGLEGLRAYRAWRAKEIGRKLHEAGIPAAYEGAKAFSNGHLIGRTHFARFLVAHGHARDVRDVFKHFLKRGKPGHVSADWASLEQAVTWIRAAGGRAVMAHPARYSLTRSKLRMLLQEFMTYGGEAMEVVSGSHTRDDYFTMAMHAKELGLLASVGSDFHGPEHAWLQMGRLPELPKGCIPVWHDWSMPSIQRVSAV